MTQDLGSAEHESMTKYARLARAAYQPEKYSEDYEKLGYSIDPELSDKYRTTFHHAGNKKTIVSYRGTKLNDPNDLMADYAIFKGREGSSARFVQSRKFAEAAVKKYGKENVSLTGHSLGGTQAITVGHQLGLQAHAFNPGVGVRTALKQGVAKLFSKFTGKKRGNGAAIHVYHTGMKDPISALSPLMRGNIKHIPVRFSKDAHGMSNFIF